MRNLQITSKLYKNSHSELDNLDSKNGVLVNFLIQEIKFEVSQIAQILAKADHRYIVITVSGWHRNHKMSALNWHSYALSFYFGPVQIDLIMDKK